MMAVEVNFDGLIGPTHNYAGLSLGNIASSANAGQVSNPRQAARQGLAKMKRLHDLGLVQGFIPPHQRPHLPTLRKLGFSGRDEDMIAAAWTVAPDLLINCYSASAMWAANAATVCPSADSADGKVHFTPANLTTMLHRSIEPATTGRLLRTIFPDEAHFVHHAPLPGGRQFSDEGAANHCRMTSGHGAAGVQIFVYGAEPAMAFQNRRFPARQSRQACEALARLHRLDPGRVVFARQGEEAIQAGAFHNDVVGVSNENTLFLHEYGFAERAVVFDEIRRGLDETTAAGLHFIVVPAAEVSLRDAVQSYLFNSQLVSLPDGQGMALILPVEAEENAYTRAYLDQLMEMDTPVERIEFIDVRESMRNGGGPACLRLRVVLTEGERAAVNPAFFLDDASFAMLNRWVDKHYRSELRAADLADPALMRESFEALDELTTLLNTGPLYDFQRAGG